MQGHQIIVFGEVLLDCFPDGDNILGGAPFNVAWHLQAFGQSPVFISRIGCDEQGEQVHQAMQQWGMGLNALQQNKSYPTGQVQVTIEKNVPHYVILAEQAYDFIEDIDLEGLNNTGVLYHGTLAARSPISRKTLQALKKRHRGKVFLDVNLRQPWWNKNDVLQLISEADWVKLNIDELSALAFEATDIEHSLKQLFSQYRRLEGIVLTCAEQGAYAMNNTGEFIFVPATNNTDIVDTVGAGDAFSVVVLVGLQLGWPLKHTMTKAEQFASAMIGQRGATVSDLAFYRTVKAKLAF